MYSFDLGDYLPILVMICVAVGLSCVLLLLPMYIADRRNHGDKLKTYECGFDQLSEESNVFDIKFYLVALLFVVFDVEVAFLFPWAVTLRGLSAVGFWSMIFFLFLLFLGFLYEWSKGALEWK